MIPVLHIILPAIWIATGLVWHSEACSAEARGAWVSFSTFMTVLTMTVDAYS